MRDYRKRRVHRAESALALFWVCAASTCGGIGTGPPNSGPESAKVGPRLSSVRPATAWSAGGVSLSLSGENFESGARAMVAGELATEVTVWSSTLITAKLPAKPGKLGRVPIVVQNPNGQENSRSDLFAYHISQLPFSSTSLNPGGSSSFAVAVADVNGV